MKHLLTLVVVLVCVCIAGTVDYNEAVISHMSNGTYEVLEERMGDVSTGELVEAYMADREYWDSLGKIK